MVSDAHRRLREATSADHQRLDRRLDIFRRIASLPERRALVERFHGFHADAEAAAEPWLAGIPGLEFEARRRSPCLARDLAALGGAPRPRKGEPVAVSGAAEAIGLLYVLEGSALGGRMIRRQVQAAGGDLAGLSFLDPYGARLGERWRAFLDILNAEARTAADHDAMVAGAVAGFRHAERRLCAEPADA